MAFPTIASKGTTYDSGGNATSHVIDLPDGIVSGNLLLVMLSSDGTPTVGWPSGWTSLADTASVGSQKVSIRYRIADATEGSSITVTTSVTETVCAFPWQIQNWHGTTAPEIATVAPAASLSLDPPTLNPSGWGTEDTLWIAFAGIDGGFDTISSYPSGYTDDQEALTTSGSTNTAAAVATRGLNAASEDPGAFVITAAAGARAHVAATIAVRPAAAAAARPPGRRLILPSTRRVRRAVYA